MDTLDNIFDNRGLLFYLHEMGRFNISDNFMNVTFFIFFVSLGIFTAFITKRFHDELGNENRDLNKFIQKNIIYYILFLILIFINDFLFSTYGYLFVLFLITLYIVMLTIYFIFVTQLKLYKSPNKLQVRGKDIIFLIIFFYVLQGVTTMFYLFNNYLVREIIVSL